MMVIMLLIDVAVIRRGCRLLVSEAAEIDVALMRVG